MGHDMPCGNCPVCDELVDLSEAGICARCRQAFHWSQCGQWVGANHVCDACSDQAAGERNG